MKKRALFIIYLFIILIFFVPTISFAKDINVSLSNDNPKPGDQITISINSSYFVLEGIIKVSDNLKLNIESSTSNSINDSLFIIEEGETIKLVYDVNQNAVPGESINISFNDINAVNIVSGELKETSVNPPEALTGTIGGAVIPTNSPTLKPSIQPSATKNTAGSVSNTPSITSEPQSSPLTTSTVKPTATATKKPAKTGDITNNIWFSGISAIILGSLLIIFTVKKLINKKL